MTTIEPPFQPEDQMPPLTAIQPLRHDRGSATLWGIALMGLLMAVAMAFAMIGSVRVAHHRVYGAADLSALAAAKLALLDPESACARAATVATANDVELAQCTITGAVAEVRTTLTISLSGFGTRTLTARSRAGPSHSDSTENTPP